MTVVILNHYSDYIENKFISNVKKKLIILNIEITTNEQITTATMKTNEAITWNSLTQNVYN